MKSKAIIEIPEGSKDKMEFKNGTLILDRILSIPVPVNYGFIINTLAEDGDALDVFVLSKKSLKTLDEVDVNILGVFQCTDQGITDHKLVGYLAGERFDDITILKNLAQIGDYLLNYKPGFVVNGYSNYDVDTYFWRNIEKYKI